MGRAIRLNVSGNERETLDRNRHMMNLLSQTPPVTVSVGNDSRFNNLRMRSASLVVTNHLIEVSGLQNFPLIDFVDITLNRISTRDRSENTVYRGRFSMRLPPSDRNSLIALLDKGNGEAASEAIDAVWAEKLSFGFLSTNLVNRASELQAPYSGSRYMLIRDADIRSGIGTGHRLRLEVRVSYVIDILLPIRIEHAVT